MKKETKVILLVALVFALLIGGIATAYILSDIKPDKSSNFTESEFSKTITVLVIVEGSETKTFTIETDAENLLDALNKIDLVDGSERTYGFFITAVDGITANENKQEWWKISKGGVDALVGVSSILIEDGDTFELTLSK